MDENITLNTRLIPNHSNSVNKPDKPKRLIGRFTMHRGKLWGVINFGRKNRTNIEKITKLINVHQICHSGLYTEGVHCTLYSVVEKE